MTITAGTKLGRYEIRSQIGAGGMGEVYLAEDMQLGRRVAIKVLTNSSRTNKPANAWSEKRAPPRQLDHPNICAVYEVGEENGQSFIVMQYLEGENLDKRVKAKAVGVKRVSGDSRAGRRRTL